MKHSPKTDVVFPEGAPSGMDEFRSRIRDGAGQWVENSESHSGVGEPGLSRDIPKKPSFWESLYLEDIGEYELHLGIPEDQIQTVIDFSQNSEDTALQNNTGDQRRFESYEKFSSWYYHDWRLVFSLLSAEGDIAWMWFGRPSELPDIHERRDRELCEEVISHESSVHTGGVRVYSVHRGKWLSVPLIRRSSHYYRRIYPDAYMVIDIDSTNLASQVPYWKCGYVLIGTGENKKTVEASGALRFIYLERPAGGR